MDYHYLLRPCVGRFAGRTKLNEYLRKNLTNFINYRDVENWLDTDQTSIPSLKDIDVILDFKSSPQLKIIALYVSPYKRLFYYFLAQLKISGLQEFLSCDKITTENFVSFWAQNKDKYLFNLEDLYKEQDGVIIHYKLEYDTLVEDLRKIPGLELTPEDFLTENREILSHYRTVYTEEIREWVEKEFSEEIETRGYTF